MSANAVLRAVDQADIRAIVANLIDLAESAGRVRKAADPDEQLALEARTWRPKADAPPWERLLERRESWPSDILPRGALLLTGAADIQKNRIEARV